MRAVNRVFVLIFILAVAAAAYAQQQDPVGLTDFPVPAWPKDGKVPADMKDKYVFIDLAKNEYVVSYPENMPATETPAAKEAYEKDGPGPARTGHYELLRNVEPAVLLTVTANAGKFKYAYSVADGPSAKQSIDQWSVVMPEGALDTINHPAGWFGVLQSDRKFKLKDPDWIRNGADAVWSFEKGEQVIQPGAVLKGFVLDSSYRPGFTIGYFRKAESVDSLIATSGCGAGANCTGIPKPVKEQLDPLLKVEYDSRTIVMLGPKFDKSADDKTIAADFIHGLDVMTAAGNLDANSDFVKGVISGLKDVQSNGGPLKMTVQPKTPVEAEIMSALKVSLNLS
jgi:hypothetical protein